MSQVPIPIEKKEFIQVLEAKAFSVEVSNLELNKSATLLIYFYGDIGLIKTECCTIVQPEYAEWTNDAWLISYVANKYGLVIKN